MPDWLTHVLAGFVVGTALTVGFDGLGTPEVTVVMVGALLPDLSKAALVVPSAVVEAVLGIPFDWAALHTPAASMLSAGVVALLVDGGYRRRAFALLVVGAATHHLLDAMLLTATGYSYALAWPLSSYHPPSPGLYLSTDWLPAAVAAIAATAVWSLRRQVERA